MTPFRQMIPALLLTATLPNSGWAEMTAEERAEFRDEVRSYLLETPEILNEMVAILDAREREAATIADRDRIAAEAARIFDDGFSFVGGPEEGDVTVVAFLDYQCGYCRRAHPEFMDMIAEDGGIRWIVKEFPILGPASEEAARAAVATLIEAGPEVYAEVNDRLLRLDGPVSSASIDATLEAAGVDPSRVRAAMDAPEVTRRLQETRALAETLGIQGTPSYVFGDRMMRGYAPIEQMQAMVAEMRASEAPAAN